MLELTVHMHETTPLPVRRESSSHRGLTFPEPKHSKERGLSSEMAGETKYVKIMADARLDQISPRVVTTACGLSVLMPGDIGGILSGMVLRIKNLVIFGGKDSPENIANNLGDTFVQMKELEAQGLIYDTEIDTYYGTLDSVKCLENSGHLRIRRVSDTEQIIEERRGELNDGDEVWIRSDRYIHSNVLFFLAGDMACLFASLQHGSRTDKDKYFCTHCYEKLDDRSKPFKIIKTDSDISLSDLACQHDMFPLTLLYLNGYGVYEAHSSEDLESGFESLTWSEDCYEQPLHHRQNIPDEEDLVMLDDEDSSGPRTHHEASRTFMGPRKGVLRKQQDSGVSYSKSMPRIQRAKNQKQAAATGGFDLISLL